MENSIASLAQCPNGANDEVRPYKIHVSSKYLSLTFKKLELTRLPHESLSSSLLGTPKSEIEPLIDFWCEDYDWRAQELQLNNELPQFRTILPVPVPEKSRAGGNIRVHFVHVRSPRRDAVPLLLIPSFPFTNLSIRHGLLKELSEPTEEKKQAFDIVVPNIPGLGFSDALDVDGGILACTAELFDALMTRLSYESYVVSGTGSGKDCIGGVDYWLTKGMGDFENCRGVHLVGPSMEAPAFKRDKLGWAKWKIAEFFHGSWWGYHDEDWKTLIEQRREKVLASRSDAVPPLRATRREPTGYDIAGVVGLREPNTVAYAFCDSPVGLLSMVCSVLKQRSPNHTLSKTEIIDITQLAWLPGPEAGLRFWTAATKEVESLGSRKHARSRAAVTVFVNGEDGYTCPAWMTSAHDVVFAQRIQATAGLLAWENPGVLVEGVRGLVEEVLKVDGRLKARSLEEVVVLRRERSFLDLGEADEDGRQLDAESPISLDTITG